MTNNLYDQLQELDLQVNELIDGSSERQDIANNLRTAIWAEMSCVEDISAHEDIALNIERLKHKIQYVLSNKWRGSNIELNVLLFPS